MVQRPNNLPAVFKSLPMVASHAETLRVNMRSRFNFKKNFLIALSIKKECSYEASKNNLRKHVIK